MMALAPQSPGSTMSDDKPYYEHHVFFCTNEREGKDAAPAAARAGAETP
jgi:hypothetical protein